MTYTKVEENVFQNISANELEDSALNSNVSANNMMLDMLLAPIDALLSWVKVVLQIN